MKLGLGLGFTPLCARNKNPLSLLDNVINTTDFSNNSSYTFSSGILAESVARAAGSADFAQADTAEQPEYDAAAFGGKGGLKIAAADNHLFYDMGATYSAQTIGGVISLPAYAGNNTVFAFGNSAQPFNTSKLFHTATGRLSWNRNEAAGAEIVFNSGSDELVVFICRINSTSSFDAYCNTLTPVNFDVDDGTYDAVSYMYIGDNDLGDTGMQFAEFFHTSDAISDSEVAAIMNHWAGKYGVTLP